MRSGELMSSISVSNTLQLHLEFTAVIISPFFFRWEMSSISKVRNVDAWISSNTSTQETNRRICGHLLVWRPRNLETWRLLNCDTDVTMDLITYRCAGTRVPLRHRPRPWENDCKIFFLIWKIFAITQCPTPVPPSLPHPAMPNTCFLTHTHTHKMNETMEEANKGKQKIRFISILIRWFTQERGNMGKGVNQERKRRGIGASSSFL